MQTTISFQLQISPVFIL